ncbi:MAG: glucose-6-phosphate isomerase [Bacteroidia bacterium]|nr:MAG: glucose-6-phosphate isomerase [Bacteroidia bacterium]
MKLEISGIRQFAEYNSPAHKQKAKSCNRLLHSKQGKGRDYLGWVDLPGKFPENLLQDIEQTAKQIRDRIDTMVTIGIGGSYLGAKAVIEALSDNFSAYKTEKDHPNMLFAGQNLSADYLHELRELLKTKNYALTVISKSGTTTEPALAFRILKKDLEEKYGEDEARERIFVVTDKQKGALKQLADKQNYKTYEIPDDVGGRFSVLTPVGLLPIAVAGFDIRALLQGAKDMQKRLDAEHENDENIAELYAGIRNQLYEKGYAIEILVNYNPQLCFFSEWWKQLFGESEGKNHKGIFPASVSFTTDLHSLGQYMQDGKRHIFETILCVEQAKNSLKIPEDSENLDRLNYLSNKDLEYVNKSALTGTFEAHLEGEVPVMKITIPEINAYHIGELIYFFEKSCGISGYMLGVNPFDQPGVETYKRNMFQILGKPGF